MKKELALVALLPMKAHSERVPGKNFRDFAGKPLFKWMLDKLFDLPEINRIVINTDARDILANFGLASTGKVLIRDRKPEICGDSVSMNRIIEDDIGAIEADVYFMTHTTNPLLSVDTVRRALVMFEKINGYSSYDSLFSVTKHQTRFYRQNGEPINHDLKNLLRTQDLEPWFEENSNFFIFTRESFQKTGSRIGERPYLFVTPHRESFDIDDLETWAIAETIAKSL